MPSPKRPRLWLIPLVVALAAAGLAGVATAPSGASTPVHEILSQVSTAAGPLFTATNHLVDGTDPKAGEFLVVWAGDVNVADNTVNQLVQKATSVGANVEKLQHVDLPDDLPGQDFLAVIDADPASSQYGKVVNTVTLGPLVENEPHHMQYVWHKGQSIYAGSLYLDTTYVFDATQLPLLKLSGVDLPTDTPCGSVPDAYWVLHDNTAYGTYMGGPDVPGPCLYTDGQTRIGNGFAGTPGSLVHISPQGKTLAEVPADTNTPVDRDPVRCPGVPTTVPSCANPHGVQVREDLNRMVTSDYAEPKNVPISDPIQPIDAHLFRDTVRIWDISNRNDPKVVNVSAMPDGPRVERNPEHEEPRGIMETTVTNLPQHKGAFVESMCGGVIYYTPDITNPHPVWREVFDDTAAAKTIDPSVGEGGGCTGGGWLQTSGDDHYLYHAVIGRNPGSLGASDTGSPKMVYALDISKLLASGNAPACKIDTIAEVFDGGHEADCPTLTDALQVHDSTSGGPHWGALDNFVKQPGGTYRETRQETRFAVSDYFVSRAGVDGDHKVCMVDRDAKGQLTFDTRFRDEDLGTPCVDFNRTKWPQGNTGAAKPHSELFVVRDDLLPKDAAGTGPDPGAVQSAGLDPTPYLQAAAKSTASLTAAPTPTTPSAAHSLAVPKVTAKSAVPANGQLVELATKPASSRRSVPRELPPLAAGLAGVLVLGVGGSTLLTARARRRHARA